MISASGKVVQRGVIPNTPEALNAFAQQWRGTPVVMECGAQSPWISHHLREAGMGLEVVVANARKVESIAKDVPKCDAHDAESLARLGRADGLWTMVIPTSSYRVASRCCMSAGTQLA